MMTKVNLISLFIFLFFLVYAPVTASPFEIKFQNEKFTINAENIPIVEILKKISSYTGLKIITSTDIDEQISFRIENKSAEEVLKNLLKNYNFALLFVKNQGSIVLDSVNIMGSKESAYLTKNNNVSENVQNNFSNMKPDLVQNIFNKNWFKNKMTDTQKLSAQVTAETVADSHASNKIDEIENQNRSGIRLTKVVENSIFYNIGFRKNDIVKDINGNAVTSASNFINLLKMNADKEIIRIERYKEDDLIDHIYIELN